MDTMTTDTPRHVITIDECRSYASEANLDIGLAKLGLAEFTYDAGQAPLRYLKVCNAAGRWTAIFLVSEFFRANNTGGYIGIASQHGFMSV